MTISNDTRGRVKKIGEPIALFFGPTLVKLFLP